MAEQQPDREVAALKKMATDRYQNDELATEVTQDAVKRGTVKDILANRKSLPQLRDAQGWLENLKREREREKNR